jgi:hypothetical protein
MTTATLPDAFAELEPFAADWAKRTREERYATRLAKSMEEIEAFYDAVSPRADDAIAYLNGLDIDALPPEADRLLRLLYSFILASYAVNVFQQPRIPDSGAAFFNTAHEPAV